MKDYSYAAPKRRRPGSFVWKLTLRQTGYIFNILCLLDILIVVLYTGSLIAVTEQAVNNVVTGSASGGTGAASVLSPGMTVTQEQGMPAGYELPRQLERELYAPEGTLRGFRLKDAEESYPWGMSRIEYEVCVPSEDRQGYTRITFDLSPNLHRFWSAAATILCAQAFLLIASLWGVSRSVRKTLAPIQQLAETAHTITSVAAPAPKHREELQLSGTIDTLNTITAKRLDTRIPIADERAELRGLASAINSMLDRLDAAYQSQLRFVSDASHELRTPIAVIQGYANLLDRWGKEDPQALQESIDAIKAEALGMQALVEQLLFLARSDNNSHVLQLEALDVSMLATQVINETQVIDKAHSFFSDIDPDQWVMGDAGMIKQTLRIFMDNAIKYTPEGERIKITASGDSTWVRVSVSDNGIGIPEKDLPKVFDRFFRSDESRARHTGGTGLGLSIAQWTIQRHGGHVEITSRKDFGTKLTMLLPTAQPRSADLPAAQ